MKTTHHLIFGDASRMTAIESNSIHLVVTSPPYPMIQMWDEPFIQQDPRIAKNMARGQAMEAFERMHRILDAVWDEVGRVLVPGGIACINIGDATRTVQDRFAFYPNHSRILSHFLKIGFSALPAILWRKQTNAPNKFMGSGMMPPGAYVTLEHEFVLILRKGDKRSFADQTAKLNRKHSAFFWEERNCWFSDVWMDLKGTVQKMKDNGARLRSAAFPLTLPYRLINMFSVKGDLVLDPFSGTATTLRAAMATGRNSLGYELEQAFEPQILPDPQGFMGQANTLLAERLQNHLAFIETHQSAKGPLKHVNRPYGFKVVTSQEKELLFNELAAIQDLGQASYQVAYRTDPSPIDLHLPSAGQLFCEEPANQPAIRQIRQLELFS
jgi:DNA modification methylase